ncbi:MarR family transcriptional regulator [Arthrobacter echini]|uniref:MarR family transcriptional regulator n=2 Tax=Arthrobacter echini TaxID=1529066 RepID=A0A4S5E047_9MICC|nr:MarR family transcriptional regulator [Arthrobacter echini]THJ64661.1 MarR family transcriptional regulator [Arthrobacter echini]TYC97146.1 MarR family transcriptional regulator [Arthrobacter echini]
MTDTNLQDHVAVVLEQWGRERPDVDVSPMAVIGRLSRVARRIEVRLGENFAAQGIDAPTFDVLATLRRSGDPYALSPKDLVETSMVTSSAIAQRLNKLEAEGLIERTSNERDGRGKLVHLTDAGRTIVDSVLPVHVAVEHEFLQALSPEQQNTLAELLAVLDH